MFIWTHDTMEVTLCYLHVPSNSSLDKFPNNTLKEYHVGLPQTVSLTGDWEVALTEIHYPHGWNNVQGNFGNRFFLRNQELSGVWEALIIPPGHYSSIEDILSKMKVLIENVERFNDDVTFSYDTFTRKVTVQLQNNVELFLVTLDTCWDFHWKKLFLIPLQLKDKWIWSMAFRTFSFTVISFSHNMLEMHWYLCFELFL